MMIYDSVNQLVLSQIPRGTECLLDLGCGAGTMSGIMKKEHACSVTGVTFSHEEAVLAREKIDRVEVQDLNYFNAAALGKYDCVVCSHVLEHLFQPEALLAKLHQCLQPGGVLIVALPNVLFWQQRLLLLAGQFRYTDGWIMDKTHYRFYDWVSARELVTTAGFAIDEAVAGGEFPYIKRLGASVSRLISKRALKWMPGLFGWQFVIRSHLAIS